MPNARQRVTAALAAQRFRTISTFAGGKAAGLVPQAAQGQLNQLWQDCEKELANLFKKSGNNFIILLLDDTPANATQIQEAMYVNGNDQSLQQVVAALNAGNGSVGGVFRLANKQWSYTTDVS